MVRYRQREYEAARDLFARISLFTPHDLDVQLRLGLAEIQLGDTASGCTRLEAAAIELEEAGTLITRYCMSGDG